MLRQLGAIEGSKNEVFTGGLPILLLLIRNKTHLKGGNRALLRKMAFKKRVFLCFMHIKEAKA
ncbi:hypothetical protein D104_05495 [Marinomonas profundimaris]|uniref:Uncharacterized protein n=1 Tax=Marinomonas profundimaris TaxID=1208321 RepID=W1S2S2_9GAMM|nr:hypothetical protein D104_05495 [Marinomonas profundimaris]